MSGAAERSAVGSTWPAIPSLLLAAMLPLIAYRPLSVGHDSAMYLQAGALLLEGKVPYVDFVDLNPPLIVYLSSVPAGFANLLGMHPLPVFLLLVWLAVVASVLATRRLLLGAWEPPASLHAELVALALAGMALLALREDHFGQREHLFALALLPYLVVRHRAWSRRPAPRLAAALAGVLAGIGACLKPHFVAIALAPEFYWAITRRRLAPLAAPETIGLAAAGFAYAAHFLVIPTAMRDAFFGRWLGLVASGYRAYDSGPSVAVAMLGYWAPPTLAAAVFFVRTARARPAWDLARALAVAALVGVGIFFAQRKLWDYHAIPAQTVFSAVVALVLAEGLPASTARGRLALCVLALRAGGNRVAAFGVAAALAGAAGLLALGSPIERNRAAILESQPFARAIASHSAPGDAVLVVMTSVSPTYPTLVQLGRRPGSRFLWFFALPMLYAGETSRPGLAFPYRVDPMRVPFEEARVRSELRNDIASLRPPLVLIDAARWCLGCPLRFGVLEYLEQTGFVDTALSGYHRAGNVETLTMFLRNGEGEADGENAGE